MQSHGLYSTFDNAEHHLIIPLHSHARTITTTITYLTARRMLQAWVPEVPQDRITYRTTAVSFRVAELAYFV